nr:MAG TPA: hypothetical protein [Bacteriophage sp.]
MLRGGCTGTRLNRHSVVVNRHIRRHFPMPYLEKN